MPPVALNLRRAPRITAADVLCVAGRFRLVGSLSLAGDAIDAAELDGILQRCPALAELDLARFKSPLALEPNSQHDSTPSEDRDVLRQAHYASSWKLLAV